MISGGLDRALKPLDFRSQNPVKIYQFYNKIYSMSYAKNLFVVSMSENSMAYFDLDKLRQGLFEPELIYFSKIKSYIKKALVLNQGNCYLEGSSKGRIAVKYINSYSKFGELYFIK